MDFDQSKVRQFIAKAEAMDRTMTRARAIAKIFFIFLIPFNNFFLQVSRGKPLLFYPKEWGKSLDTDLFIAYNSLEKKAICR